MFRFIHSADLHLGKRFGSFSGDLPGRLREARHNVLARLADHAHSHGASAILLAGDTFDTETPAPDVRRQALAEMAQHKDIRWVILPGNHDSLQAAQLWSNLRNEAPDNVVLAVDPSPIALAEDVALLPAPCTTRRPGRDLTEWMDACATADGMIRIGLAHGAITEFSEDKVASDVITPDRAVKAGLDYLALGDWHGAIEVNPRTHYSGSPEQDRFKHDRPGEALLVSIAGPSASPQVDRLRTGTFVWQSLDLHLLDGENPVQALAQLLPSADRRQSLARVQVSGNARLAARTALAHAAADMAHDFAWFELEDSELVTVCEVDDLDQIDKGGALRQAADALLAEGRDDRRSEQDRGVANAALARLYAFAQQVS